jgi:chemotaxis protein CheD
MADSPMHHRRLHAIKGFYNREFQTQAVKLMLGEFRVSNDPTIMMMTTLGSCVAACVRDPVAEVGGMNHFLLPDVPESDSPTIGVGERYGSVAMERLINAVLAAGGQRGRLEVKVFGGARVIDSSFDVGEQNSRFVLDYIRREGLTLAGQDLGGQLPRRIHWFPHSGRAWRRFLNHEALNATAREEIDYRRTLRDRPIDGDIELFGEADG